VNLATVFSREQVADLLDLFRDAERFDRTPVTELMGALAVDTPPPPSPAPNKVD
jgi:hypothetical protein